MNFPFGTSGPNVDRFNFLRRAQPQPVQQPLPPPGPHPATIETYNPYDFSDGDDDDRAPLSPRRAPEMTERPSQQQQHQSRFSRLSSYLRPGQSFRPSSSHYSGPAAEVIESPKTPDFPRIGQQNLPSTRLHLPNLTRTWTEGSNGPPTRDGQQQQVSQPIQEPAPAVVTERRRERRRHRREGSSGSSGRRHRREGSGSSGNGRRRRRRHAGTDTTTSGSNSSRTSSSRRGPPPKHFLFCFPWIKSRRIRSQILKCFVSGVFLASLLTVYLSLSLTKNIKGTEFTILLILIILAITIFFCHSLIRLCMLVVKNRKATQSQSQSRDVESGGNRNNILAPGMLQPPPVFGGYAIPRQPIRVTLASDEEAVGVESVTKKISPPAYGLWRESVRVDPTRLYWQRNEGGVNGEGEGLTRIDTQQTARRPPSYSSDDGVSYVVEARPRSTLVPLGQMVGEGGGQTGRW
ncbi:hypothetical protein QBC38DRAFT_99940 [Podospora fimiseda]|uniref:Uncharacterized protein n=1 Tax=Podospora fimiseda TaxID=252190 RepID=A0AAN7BFK6_9PEZI|nr:hypothetical protein QBC38DRAFT_99940 [Podospora fimiseda]